MNHDRAHKAFRLCGLALQFERGELDAKFASAEISVEAMREVTVRRIRQLADAIESGER